MIFLKQATASQEIPLGYFLDSTDGNTAETGLTIDNTDIKLWKTGATTLADKNSGGATHIAGGIYYCVLDATDTNTLGPMKVSIHVAGALAVQVFCEVLAATVYDAIFGTTGDVPGRVLGSSTTAFSGVGVQADVITSNGLPVYNFDGTLASGASNKITFRTSDAASATIPDDSRYVNCELLINGGTGTGQVLSLTSSTANAREYNVEVGSNPVTCDSTSTYVILGSRRSSISQWLGTAPNSLVSGRVDSSVGAIAANAITAASIATDAGTEIADAVLTRQMTESYNTDGVAPTVAQSLFGIFQAITEMSISGTTLTVNKLDGSTSAMTFTLNDATNPTSRTRAS